jgi:YVTN family beta-propeller protein
MRCTPRTTMVIVAAITGLGLAAPAAAAASASSARGTAQAAKGCITVTATIDVGGESFGVAADPKTDTIYVANFDKGTVSVISGRTNTVTATVPVGGGPATADREAGRRHRGDLPAGPTPESLRAE